MDCDYEIHFEVPHVNSTETSVFVFCTEKVQLQT